MHAYVFVISNCEELMMENNDKELIELVGIIIV